MFQIPVYLFKDDPNRSWKSPDDRCRGKEFLHAVQGEAGSEQIEFHLMRNRSEPFDLTGNAVTFYMTKPDGRQIFLTADVPAATAAQGIAAVLLTAQCTAASGIAKRGEVRVTAGDGSVLKFPAPDISVSRSDTENAVESTSEFQALDEALNRADETVQNYQAERQTLVSACAQADTAAAAAGAAAQDAAGAAAQARNVPRIGEDGYWYTFSPNSSQYEKTDEKAALSPRGTWVSGTAYGKNDCVYSSQDNASYCSLQDGNTAVPADDGVHWMTLCRGIGVTTDNNYTDADKAKVDAAVPDTRKIAGQALSGDITLQQLLAAGLASGDAAGNAQNALQLGGTEAAGYALKDYGHDFSDNGYVKLSNGLILEWIVYAIPPVAANNTYDNQFALAHIGTLYHAAGSLTPGAAWDYGNWAIYKTDGKVHIVLSNGPTAQQFYAFVLAIGM